jgi:hypothetical protein
VMQELLGKDAPKTPNEVIKSWFYAAFVRIFFFRSQSKVLPKCMLFAIWFQFVKAGVKYAKIRAVKWFIKAILINIYDISRQTCCTCKSNYYCMFTLTGSNNSCNGIWWWFPCNDSLFWSNGCLGGL